MWNVKKEIAHHEKMIGILEMIETLNNRILSNIKYEKTANENDFFGMKKHYKKRLEIDTNIKNRLVNYYNKKNFRVMKEKNFYWEIITPKKAKEIFKEGKKEIYKLFSDETEALIESEHDLNDAIDLKIELAMCIKI